MNSIRISLMAFLAMMLISASAFAGSSLEKSSANDAGAVSAGISVGYSTASKMFDNDGEAQDQGDDPFVNMPIGIDVNYGIMDNLDAGVSLSLQNNTVGDASGMGMREAVIGVGYEVAGAYITAGFKLDLGKKPADLDGDLATSDHQNGIAIGVHYNHGLSDVMNLHVGLGVVHSLGDGEDTPSANGLLLDPNVGIGYSLGDGMSAGLDIGYFLTQDATFDGTAIPDSASNALYVTPWFAMGVAGGDLSIALGQRGENMHSGINLMGKNAESMRMGATVGWSKSF